MEFLGSAMMQVGLCTAPNNPIVSTRVSTKFSFVELRSVGEAENMLNLNGTCTLIQTTTTTTTAATYLRFFDACIKSALSSIAPQLPAHTPSTVCNLVLPRCRYSLHGPAVASGSTS